MAKLINIYSKLNSLICPFLACRSYCGARDEPQLIFKFRAHDEVAQVTVNLVVLQVPSYTLGEMVSDAFEEDVSTFHYPTTNDELLKA